MREKNRRIHVDHVETYCNQLWVDTQVLPVTAAHISKQAARRERVQKVANVRPGRVASAAEVGGDGVVHSMDILFLQVGGVRVAGGQGGRAWPRGFLTVTG